MAKWFQQDELVNNIAIPCRHIDFALSYPTLLYSRKPFLQWIHEFLSMLYGSRSKVYTFRLGQHLIINYLKNVRRTNGIKHFNYRMGFFWIQNYRQTPNYPWRTQHMSTFSIAVHIWKEFLPKRYTWFFRGMTPLSDWFSSVPNAKVSGLRFWWT